VIGGGFVRTPAAGLLTLTGIAIMGYGLGTWSWRVAVSGSIALAAGIAVFVVVRIIVLVAGTGRVLDVAESPNSSDSGCLLRLRIDAPSFEPAVIEVYDPSTPADKVPEVDDVLPVLIPVSAPWKSFVAWSHVPLPASVSNARMWHRSVKRVRLLRRRRLVVGYWPWWGSDFDDLFEVGRGWLASTVLAWQEWYCGQRLEVLLETPEMLSLRTVATESELTIRKRALSDQAAIYDDTTGFRHTAAVLTLLAAGLLLFTLWIVAPALFGVLADIFIGLGILVDVLFAGADEKAAALERWAWSEAVVASGLPRVDLYLLLGCVPVLCAAAIRAGLGVIRAAIAALSHWHGAISGIVEWRLREAFRESLNFRGALLQLRTAPGLAGADSGQLVRRPEAARLRGLAFDLGAGAIAVSGARGVGKTTLLAMLTSGDGDESEALRISVSAPVQYDAREFLLHLYAQLCKAVLREAGAAETPVARTRAWAKARTFAAALLRAVAWTLVGALIVTLFVPEPHQWLDARLPLPESPATAVIVAVSLLFLAKWTGGRRRLTHPKIAAEAERRLRQTRFLQTLAVEQHGVLGRSGLEIGRRRSRQLAEQPLSLPEIVDGYREFAAQVVRWWRGQHGDRAKLLIGIDEVDRIADPALAEQFLNEIKAIFGVQHCVYLVSVSEEALANFERRVVRMRTVFDSAFDHVVRLQPLNLTESVRLLRRRLTGVPDRFLVLCHCLAGGMPRDVLRTARTMLDVHRESLGASSLTTIATKLVAAEVEALKRGFLGQIATAPPDRTAQRLADLLADAEWPGATGSAIREAVERDLGTQPGSAPSLAGGLLFYATVLEVFTQQPDIVDDWVADLDKWKPETAVPTEPSDLEPGDEESRIAVVQEADAIAALHRILPINAPLAMRHLDDIRARLGLSTTKTKDGKTPATRRSLDDEAQAPLG